MSFPKYEKYKDSGVEWLGEVPEHWICIQLKHLGRSPIQNGVGAASDIDNPDFPRYIRITDLAGPRELRADTFRSLPPDVANDAKFEIGDLLFACVGATFGKSYLHIKDIGPVCYAGYLARLQPSNHVDPRFISYWSQSAGYWAQVESRVIQSTVQNFSASKYRALELCLPPLPEQSAIAAFLDHETAKIDALVEEQRRLIELLKEKRQAVISHAVTKGLNPDAPMKDSGVEWLGEVPEHWSVMPIRYAARLESGHTPSRSKPEWWVECDIPWISLSDVWQIRDGRSIYIEETKEKVSELGLANSAARLLPKGTVVLSRTASVGFSGIMGSDMATTQDFANWVPTDKVLSEYLLYSFRSMSLEFERLKYGSTHNTIYMPDIISMRFVLPPLDEQEQIVEYIAECTGTIDHLSDEAKRMIDILQERRTALISAAVTGKIDVRNHAPTSEGVPA